MRRVFIAEYDLNAPWQILAAFWVPLLVLEPGLVAYTGGTIGHHLRGLRVRRVGEDRTLNLVLACVRFLIKFSLWWLSLVFVPLTLDLSEWYASRSLLVLAAFAVFVGYGFYTALAGRPIFRNRLAAASWRAGSPSWVISVLGSTCFCFSCPSP